MQKIIDEDLAKENSKVEIPDQESLLKDDDKGDSKLLNTLSNLEDSYVSDEKKKKH